MPNVFTSGCFVATHELGLFSSRRPADDAQGDGRVAGAAPSAARHGYERAEKPGSAAPVLEKCGRFLAAVRDAGIVAFVRSPSIHRPPEPRRFLWNECLASRHF